MKYNFEDVYGDAGTCSYCGRILEADETYEIDSKRWDVPAGHIWNVTRYLIPACDACFEENMDQDGEN
jgi:hypothetical protein